jgi:hypothetical protein
MNSIQTVTAYAHLRALVAFLGSGPQNAWWDCNFMSDVGIRFLANPFPRSAAAAAINSTMEAARRLHDQELGRKNCYHLFRLPAGNEDLICNINGGDITSWTKETALDALDGLAEARVVAPQGPVQIGIAKRILTATSVQELAAHYHSAFSQGIRCFPYFSES